MRIFHAEYGFSTRTLAMRLAASSVPQVKIFVTISNRLETLWGVFCGSGEAICKATHPADSWKGYFDDTQKLANSGGTMRDLAVCSRQVLAW